MFANPHDRFARLIETEEIAHADIRGLPIEAAFAYWEAQRGEKIAPSRRDFRLDDLPPALIPCLAMIDFVGPPLDFYYRFFGSRMVDVAGRELTGKTYYADDVKGYGFANAKLLPLMIEKRRPLFHRVTWESDRGSRFVTTTARLPLSEDGETITGAVTANDYRPLGR